MFHPVCFFSSATNTKLSFQPRLNFGQHKVNAFYREHLSPLLPGNASFFHAPKPLFDKKIMPLAFVRKPKTVFSSQFSVKQIQDGVTQNQQELYTKTFERIADTICRSKLETEWIFELPTLFSSTRHKLTNAMTQRGFKVGYTMEVIHRYRNEIVVVPAKLGVQLPSLELPEVNMGDSYTEFFATNVRLKIQTIVNEHYEKLSKAIEDNIVRNIHCQNFHFILDDKIICKEVLQWIAQDLERLGFSFEKKKELVIDRYEKWNEWHLCITNPRAEGQESYKKRLEFK